MKVEPRSSVEMGKDFLEWENGGDLYYDMGEERQEIFYPTSRQMNWIDLLLSVVQGVQVDCALDEIL